MKKNKDKMLKRSRSLDKRPVLKPHLFSTMKNQNLRQ